MYRPDCLSDQTLADLLGGDVDEKQRAAAEEHLSRCPLCRERLSAELLVREPPVDAKAPDELKRRARDMVPAQRTSSRLWLPLAAAVVVVLGGSLIWRTMTPEEGGDGDVLRQVAPQAAVELRLPAADGVTTGERALFSWKPIESARRYDFELIDETGDFVFEASTTEASVELLRTNLAVHSGGVYYWSVRALLRDGTVLDSELRRIDF